MILPLFKPSPSYKSCSAVPPHAFGISSGCKPALGTLERKCSSIAPEKWQWGAVSFSTSMAMLPCLLFVLLVSSSELWDTGFWYGAQKGLFLLRGCVNSLGDCLFETVIPGINPRKPLQMELMHVSYRWNFSAQNPPSSCQNSAHKQQSSLHPTPKHGAKTPTNGAASRHRYGAIGRDGRIRGSWPYYKQSKDATIRY